MIFIAHLIYFNFGDIRNYTIANSLEAIEAQSKIPLRRILFTANIPQADEAAK